jgi:hypothetical protein
VTTFADLIARLAEGYWLRPPRGEPPIKVTVICHLRQCARQLSVRHTCHLCGYSCDFHTRWLRPPRGEPPIKVTVICQPETSSVVSEA